MPTDPTWLEIIKQMLCRMYEAWGGDCNDLDPNPAPRIGQVADKYAQDGAPNLDKPGTAQFLVLLNEVEAHLALPANSLEDEDETVLTTLIANLRADLDG